MALTTQQIESIQTDYGIIFLDYGLPTQTLLGPTSGGADVKIEAKLRDIEFDGAKGKSKGMKVIDSIEAMIKTSIMSTELEILSKFMPHGVLNSGVISDAPIGLIGSEKYLSNITMFAKLVGGQYKKITLYNVMNEAPLSLSAKSKDEAKIQIELVAHYDPTNDNQKLYEITDVANFIGDVVLPTVTTVPIDAATGVNVSANLIATFSEQVRQGDINSSNFKLIKSTDGVLIAGTLTYNASTRVVTFDPTANLSAATAYIWTISGVRDLNGNVISPTIVNFTTT